MNGQLFIAIFVLLLSLHKFYAQDDERYSECSRDNPVFCGQNLFYPFWGGNLPSYCGLEGFKLGCQNNDYSVIDISTQTFRIVGMYEASASDDERESIIFIARNDLGDDICPQELNSTMFNETFFDYRPSYNEVLRLFYDCPSGLNIPSLVNSIRNNFTCMNNGIEKIGFVADESLSDVQIASFQRCMHKITVPVLRTALHEFGNNASVTLQELLKQGFVVHPKIEERACSACENSGGLCWNGTVSAQPTCLCRDGVHPSLCPQGRGRRARLGFKIGLGIGAAIIGILLMCFIIYIKKFTSVLFLNQEAKKDKDVEAFIRQYGASTPKRYRYSELKKITNSFKDELGRGGYGNVYKGKLQDDRVVAVKVLNASKGNGEEFINEVASIGTTSHVNVVSLLGFCYESKKRALIYEFMPNGSLEKFIYGKIPSTEGHHLGWEKLYDIALGISRGLEYLHRGCNTPILHFDIKPHNILLDEDFCPKISDFGLAKLYTRKESIVSMMEARGTIGYIAPEIFSRNFGGVSHKSDVYSYGMMVLEMVGGRKNVDVEVDHTSEIYFPHWIYSRIKLEEDLSLQGEMTIEENEIARKMIIVGLWCIQTNPSQRPSIDKVIDMLEGSIEALEIPPKPYLCSP